MRLQKIVDETGMVALGAHLAEHLTAASVVYLQGELGVGKTTLARAVVQALGHAGPVKSPTYTLVEAYRLDRLSVYHFDLYRVADARELEFIGMRDYFGHGSAVLVEWPENGAGFLPPPDLVVTICRQGRDRRVELAAKSPGGLQWLSIPA